jgi:hypothetical protein
VTPSGGGGRGGDGAPSGGGDVGKFGGHSLGIAGWERLNVRLSTIGFVLFRTRFWQGIGLIGGTGRAGFALFGDGYRGFPCAVCCGCVARRCGVGRVTREAEAAEPFSDGGGEEGFGAGFAGVRGGWHSWCPSRMNLGRIAGSS